MTTSVVKRPRTPPEIALPSGKTNVSPKLRQRSEMPDGAGPSSGMATITAEGRIGRPRTADGHTQGAVPPKTTLPSLGSLFSGQHSSHPQPQHYHPYAVPAGRSAKEQSGGYPSPSTSSQSSTQRYSNGTLSSSSSRGSDPSMSSLNSSWPASTDPSWSYASPAHSPLMPQGPSHRVHPHYPSPSPLPLTPMTTASSPYLPSLAYYPSPPLMQAQPSSSPGMSPHPTYPTPSPGPVNPSPPRSGRPYHPVGGSSGSSYRGSLDEGYRHPGAPLQPYPPLPVTPQEEAKSWLARGRKGEDMGLKLDDFEMIDTLGTGTFGRVLLVRLRTPKTGMPVFFAMKVLIKHEVHRMGQVEHINWERAILAGIQHPSIVNLCCTFQDERNLYILLEFVQGGELFSHLRRAVRFSPDVARFYSANILLALEYLHSRDVIYRDLKPENLLLDAQGYIKIADFGFAKFVPDRTFTLCGTPHFLSPETIRGTGHGKAADWWAFGVLLFEMICGYPPFFDENPLVIYEKILNGHIVFPPYVDPLAKDLIKRLLTADLSRRLGNLRNGALDIKTHSWYAGVDWSAVARREINAPIVPKSKGQGDMSNFERYPPTNLRDLPALERAHMRRQLGPSYTEPTQLAPDPYRGYFEAFGN